jgi:hypothetical protein
LAQAFEARLDKAVEDAGALTPEERIRHEALVSIIDAVQESRRIVIQGNIDSRLAASHAESGNPHQSVDANGDTVASPDAGVDGQPLDDA